MIAPKPKESASRSSGTCELRAWVGALWVIRWKWGSLGHLSGSVRPTDPGDEGSGPAAPTARPTRSAKPQGRRSPGDPRSPRSARYCPT